MCVCEREKEREEEIIQFENSDSNCDFLYLFPLSVLGQTLRRKRSLMFFLDRMWALDFSHWLVECLTLTKLCKALHLDFLVSNMEEMPRGLLGG